MRLILITLILLLGACTAPDRPPYDPYEDDKVLEPCFNSIKNIRCVGGFCGYACECKGAGRRTVITKDGDMFKEYKTCYRKEHPLKAVMEQQQKEVADRMKELADEL